jgi:hypothetical protein
VKSVKTRSRSLIRRSSSFRRQKLAAIVSERIVWGDVGSRQKTDNGVRQGNRPLLRAWFLDVDAKSTR